MNNKAKTKIKRQSEDENRLSPQGTVNSTPSIAQNISVNEVTKLFLKKVKRQEDGSNYNNILEAFLLTMTRLMEEQSFSLPDVLALGRSMDLPNQEVILLFDQFVHHLITWGKLTEIDGCYSYPVYVPNL
jgi:hypothetical protein